LGISTLAGKSRVVLSFLGGVGTLFSFSEKKEREGESINRERGERMEISSLSKGIPECAKEGGPISFLEVRASAKRPGVKKRKEERTRRSLWKSFRSES